MGCDAKRKEFPFFVECNTTGKVEDVGAADAERQWISFTGTFQSLRISSL